MMFFDESELPYFQKSGGGVFTPIPPVAQPLQDLRENQSFTARRAMNHNHQGTEFETDHCRKPLRVPKVSKREPVWGEYEIFMLRQRM